MGRVPERSLSAKPLSKRVREAEGGDLLAIVRDESDQLDVGLLRALLANPFVTREVLNELGRATHLQSSHEVRFLLAGHRLMPEVHSLRLVPSLYWNGLVRLGADVRVRPAVRRAADRRLASRLPGLSVGEKIAIARRTGIGASGALMKDPNRAVIEALLVNPRLTEGLLIPHLRNDQASRLLLESVGRHAKWGMRYSIRLALCLHPTTPPAVSLPLVSYLKKADLDLILRDVRIPPAVRRRAELFLGR